MKALAMIICTCIIHVIFYIQNYSVVFYMTHKGMFRPSVLDESRPVYVDERNRWTESCRH